MPNGGVFVAREGVRCAGQLHWSGGKRFAGENCFLRLIDSQILNSESRGCDDCRDWQRDKNEFGFNRRLEIESDF